MVADMVTCSAGLLLPHSARRPSAPQWAILPPACTLPCGCVQTAASMPPHGSVSVRSMQLARCWGLAAERKHDRRLNFSTPTLIKFSAEMLAVIELLFKTPVRTWPTLQTSSTSMHLPCKVPNTQLNSVTCHPVLIWNFSYRSLANGYL